MPATSDRSSAGHKILGYLALFFVLGIVLIPYTYVGLSAFKSPMEMFDVKWIPDEWSLEAWKYVIFDLKFQNYLFNSFLSGLGGLTRPELFLTVSVFLLVVLSALLAELVHVLIERGLTFVVLAVSGVIASIATRLYEPAKANVRRFMAGAATVVIVFLTLTFPPVAYSIDAYTSFPVSEEAGLKFLARTTPMETKMLKTTSGAQIVLYQPFVGDRDNIIFKPSLWDGDIFIFRMTGYYYAALRFDLSFEDNRLTRLRDVVRASPEFNSVYWNPTTHIFIRR